MTEAKHIPMRIQESLRRRIGERNVYKSGKWAAQIVEAQDREGKWGWFHTLSKYSGANLTTEQALRRLEILGFGIEDESIQRAVAYMEDCLLGRKNIPDRREKLHNWDVFTSLMLAAWIRRFAPDNLAAFAVAKKWASIIRAAFSHGNFCMSEYEKAYLSVFGEKPRGGRLVDFVSFYQLSLVNDMLDENTESSMLDYVLKKPDGIYYIYGKRICELPTEFYGRKASYYISALELLARYPHAKQKLGFAADWICENRMENGMWDLGGKAADGIWLPLSDNWRKKGARATDCTARIEKLMGLIM